MLFSIRTTSPHVPEVAAVIRAHNAFCNAISPPESCHKLNELELDVPTITLWGAWRDGEVLGIGALKLLTESAGEVKSMHTVAAARGARRGGGPGHCRYDRERCTGQEADQSVAGDRHRAAIRLRTRSL